MFRFAFILEDEANFLIYNGKTFNLPYDFASVMHYKTNAFGIDRKGWTIKPVPAHSNAVIGQRNALSTLDVQRINKFYKCDEAKTSVCGYFWTEPDFQGLMTVIYEGVLKEYYQENKRSYASAEILRGFEVSYFTDDAPDGVILGAGQQYHSFQPVHQSGAKRRECVRVAEDVELNDGT